MTEWLTELAGFQNTRVQIPTCTSVNMWAALDHSGATLRFIQPLQQLWSLAFLC